MKINIKELIKSRDMTMAEFSKKIGTYPSTVSLWLASGYPIPRKYLKPISKLLKVSQKSIEHSFRPSP